MADSDEAQGASGCWFEGEEGRDKAATGEAYGVDRDIKKDQLVQRMYDQNLKGEMDMEEFEKEVTVCHETGNRCHVNTAWIMRVTQRMRMRTRTARNIVIREKTEDAKDRFKEARNKYVRELRNARKTAWRQVLTGVQQDTWDTKY